jgi:hypothetical protein
MRSALALLALLALASCGHASGKRADDARVADGETRADDTLAQLTDGAIGCFAWSPDQQVYACGRVVAWPGDRCVNVDLVGKDDTRSVPVAGGKRCGSEKKLRADDVVQGAHATARVHTIELTPDTPVDAGGATIVLHKVNGEWRISRQCAAPPTTEPGAAAVGGVSVSGKLPGFLASKWIVTWAPGASFMAVAGFSSAAMEPGAPVEMVTTAPLDLECPKAPSP